VLWLMFVGTISFGQFFTLWFYSFWIFQPLYMLGTLVTSYQETRASLSQLGEFLKIQPAPVPKDAVVLGNLEKIVYKDVSLAYEGAEREALSGINIEINSGESVAFVGPSGSGKSTMVKLLSGLYDTTSGSVSINGVDLKKVNVYELRGRIGLVAQETQLFAGTIKENLLFVKPDASDEECLKALEEAQAKSIIERTDTGLDTKIGEGGLKLSGGEKQRLAIARALLRDPDLIVFDEATSSLDSITESAITETIKGLRELKPNLIQILVAHRLSTVAHVDKIYVFEHGKIIESGDHKSLIAEKGLYHALWREQVAGEK